MASYEFHWKREYSLFYGASAMIGLVTWMRKDFDKEIDARGEGYQGWFSVFGGEGVLDMVKNNLAERIHESAYFDGYMDELEAAGKKFVRFARSIKINEATLSSVLASLYRQYFEALNTYVVHLFKSFYMVEAGSKLFEELLRKKVSEKDFSDALAAYSKPSKKAGVLLIGDKFAKLRSLEEKKQYVLKEFPWITAGDPFQTPMGEKEALEFCKSFIIPKENKSRAKVQFTDEEKHTVKLFQKLLYLKDKRDDFRREAFYHGYILVEEIARRLKLEVQELGYLLPDEVDAAFGGKEFRQEIERRKKGYIVTVADGKIHIISGEEAVKQLLEKQNIEDVKEFKGIVGSSGKAKGIVQVIKSLKGIEHFTEGSVLVAVTTNPEYIPAMQKAVAFVTDEGSITSHASIVAREMGKPCIVAARIATKVLKDGDMVEVDAVIGVVRKINQKV